MLKLILVSACTLLLLAQPSPGQSLKLYPEGNLKGQAQPMEDGYYDQLESSVNDWAVSFELAAGHIATFAENSDGTGSSRVYIAIDEKISINLPPSLQKTVSFIRVSPWKNTRKKSACAAGENMMDTLNATWFYNWSGKGSSTDSLQFVPMSWGGGDEAGMKRLGMRMDVSHHLGFNEPDGNDQSNLTVDQAIKKFKILQASGLRLSSPGPKDNVTGRKWLDDFMEKALKEGLRIDFIALHYYKKTKPAQFRQWLKYVEDKYNLPIWVTEFNYGGPWNWKAVDSQEHVNGLIGYMEMLDANPSVERYAFFNWQPPSKFSLYASKNPEVLNAAGKFLSKHRSPVSLTARNYVPVPWTDNRIGAFYPVSKASFVEGEKASTFEIQSAGHGISGVNDQLHFVHQPLSSDGLIATQVKAASGAVQSIEAGVMIRESQAPDSKCIMIGLTGKGEAFLHVRSETGEKIGAPTTKSLSGNPQHVRLVRKGDQFIGSVSGDGKQWKQVFDQKIEMPKTVSYGICVTSNKPGELATVTFDHVKVDTRVE